MAITKKTLMEELELMVRDDITSQETIIRLSEENKILKDRIEKAIEYIENKSTDEDTGEELGYSDNINYKELLDILRGEDNE